MMPLQFPSEWEEKDWSDLGSWKVILPDEEETKTLSSIGAPKVLMTIQMKDLLSLHIRSTSFRQVLLFREFLLQQAKEQGREEQQTSILESQIRQLEIKDRIENLQSSKVSPLEQNDYQVFGSSHSLAKIKPKKKYRILTLENSDQLLSVSVAHVLRVIKCLWEVESPTTPSEKEEQQIYVQTPTTIESIRKGKKQMIKTLIATDAELAYGTYLKEQSSEFIEDELKRNEWFKNFVGRSIQSENLEKEKKDESIKANIVHTAFTALLNSLDNAHGIEVRDPIKDRQETQLSVAELLSLSPTDKKAFCNIVNANTKRKRIANATTNSYPEAQIHLVRSMIASLLSFEDHARPYLEQLFTMANEYITTGTKSCIEIVKLYAIHVGAIHVILEMHPQAADHLADDILSFIEPGEGNSSQLSLDELQDISRELRDRVPSLRMPNDLDFDISEKMRQRHPHLNIFYFKLHNALCKQAYKNNFFHDENFSSVEVIDKVRKLLYILGADKSIASGLKSSESVRAISRWTEAILDAHEKPDIKYHFKLKNMRTVASIVSALQEAQKVFGDEIEDGVLKSLQLTLKNYIDQEFPRLASEAMEQLGQSEEFPSMNHSAIAIVRYLLRSPNGRIQIDGLNALTLFAEPFAMRHFYMHKERGKAKMSEQTSLQIQRLGDSYVEYLRPYDKPIMEKGGSRIRYEKNLSLGHIGPIPPGKGALVQEQLDRTVLQGGVYPLVVLIGVSGLGKSDILEQLSKYHFKPDGTLVVNEAELLLPLAFENKIQLQSRDKRRELEQLTLVNIAATMCTALAILRGHRKLGKAPPTPHELFRYHSNGGGALVKDFIGTLLDKPDPFTISVVRRCRFLLLEELIESARFRKSEDDGVGIFAQVSFAIDEVNLLAGMFQNEIKKSTDKGSPTGSMLTAVSHVLQFVGSTVYAGTGLRYDAIEEAVSAIGKDIIVMAPSLPPASYRTIVYMLHRLLDFKNLRQGEGALPMQTIEVCMLTGRMRFLELFITNLLQVIPEESSLSMQDCPDRIFCKALVNMGEYMMSIVSGRIIPTLLERGKNVPHFGRPIHSAFELASCGVMYVKGKPGDPSDAENILVQCGLVQLSDSDAHKSNRRGEIGNRIFTGDGYFFMNREPIMQCALARALFDSRPEIIPELEEHIWSAIVIPESDSHVNGIETLGWMLLRAMSRDQMLQELLTGKDSDLQQYSNDIEFVWRDSSEGSLGRNSQKWLEELEQNDDQDFDKEVGQVFGVSGIHQDQLDIVEDLWFHVCHLTHSDPSRAHFMRQAAVFPPQGIGADIVGSWSHKLDSTMEPLLMLMSCSKSTEYKKLKMDARSTLPSNIGKNSRYQKACTLLHGRTAIRFLLHPTVNPGKNVRIDVLTRSYKVSEAVIEAGYGRDEYDNFVVLLNRKTLSQAIAKRKSSTAEHPMSDFVSMVLRLWKRYFDQQDGKA